MEGLGLGLGLLLGLGLGLGLGLELAFQKIDLIRELKLSYQTKQAGE